MFCSTWTQFSHNSWWLSHNLLSSAFIKPLLPSVMEFKLKFLVLRYDLFGVVISLRMNLTFPSLFCPPPVSITQDRLPMTHFPTDHSLNIWIHFFPSNSRKAGDFDYLYSAILIIYNAQVNFWYDFTLFQRIRMT